MHGRPAHPWTVIELAKQAALKRSPFFERFSRAVGIAPMEYRLTWRMALAKNLLRRAGGRIAEIAGRVGYSVAITFSVAFHAARGPAARAICARRTRGDERRMTRNRHPETCVHYRSRNDDARGRR